jgi:hypothetical protein
MKRLSLIVLLCASACSSDDPDQEPAGGADAAPDNQGTPTFTSDVQPILEQRCGPCHTTGNAGGVNHARDFAATRQPSSVCAGQMVFECMLTRVKNGSMPPGAGCTGDPSADADNDACLTADEHDTLESWVAAGAPEGETQQLPPDGDPDPYDPY